jgi:asparagine synthase (glutamine-hydrolysing)
MASSVEMRLPLVDHRLVETVIGLRKGTRDYKLGPKAWLRAAARNWLPEWALARPKRGFTPPMALWMAALEKGYAGDLKDGYLASSGLFNDASFLERSRDPFSREATVSMPFRLLVLESWSRAMASAVGR